MKRYFTRKQRLVITEDTIESLGAKAVNVSVYSSQHLDRWDGTGKTAWTLEQSVMVLGDSLPVEQLLESLDLKRVEKDPRNRL